jgi:hypothetical protein
VGIVGTTSAGTPADRGIEPTCQFFKHIETAMAEERTEIPRPPKAFSMSRDDAIFLFGLTLFGGGLSMISAHIPIIGAILLLVGIAALVWANRNHMPRPSLRFTILILAMLITTGLSGYDLYDRYFGNPAPFFSQTEKNLKSELTSAPRNEASPEDRALREEIRKFVASNVDEIRDSIFQLNQALTTTNSQLNGDRAQPLNHLFEQLMGPTIQRAINDLDRAANGNADSNELVSLLIGFIGQYGTWQPNVLAFYRLAGAPSNVYIEEMLAGLRKADERAFGKLRDLKAILPADRRNNLDDGNLTSRNGFFLQWQKKK